AYLPTLETPPPADLSDALAGRGDVASPPLGPRIGEDDLRGGSESFSEEDDKGYAVRTGRRERDTATHPPSDHDESPAGDNPDTPIHPTRNMRKKRNITSASDPVTPALKEPVIEAVLAKEGNVTIASGATPAPIPLSAGSKAEAKAVKKREKFRKKKIEKA
ncbi:hypothetical protein MMC28_011353, partial [Mycoblastus sanguinarius]|nr:hypothetical protein [Mycoblastus sanguinarius]